MDGMHFGMGCSCLQITYETQNINHARFLYDMFLPWTPIMSALSATTPILKGHLSDHDFRWEVIEQAVDCRTAQEKDPNSAEYICKSRYSTVSRYISNHEYVKDFHNDCNFRKICPEVKQALAAGGLDDRLATHIASLFVRTPIPVYEKELAFPCCKKEQADEIIERINSQGVPASPSKIRSTTSSDEENKSESQVESRDEVTSCSSFLGEGVKESDLEGVCTAWFLKCPPIDGNSHFENI